MKQNPRCRWNAVLFLPLILAVTPAHADCRLATIGTFSLQLPGYPLLIPGKLNGHDTTILADTGAGESLIWLDAVEQAGLRPVRDTRYTMTGISGKTTVYKVKVEELTIGDFVVRNKVWPVIGGRIFDERLGMILGADFWSKLDFEINLADREIILWDATGCENTSPVYWSREFMLAKLEQAGRGLIQTDVLINGTRIRAMFDTGAVVTMMDSGLARRIGFRTEAADSGTSSQVAGIGDRGKVDSFVATFDTFQMGDLTIKNARIRVLDMDRHIRTEGGRIRGPAVDINRVVIGADFLLANRVFVANSQSALYMTYSGGQVFQAESLPAPAAEAAPVEQNP